MIISANGTTYDTADGSETLHAATTPAAGGNHDGVAGQSTSPAGPRIFSAVIPAIKPAWSVLSLKDLTEARRLSALAEPAHAAAREESRRDVDRRRAAAREADTATAVRDKDRNAWETT